LTIVGFVSPSFWIYAIVALLVLAWAGARDENPLALFAITLFVIPNVSFYIPAILVNNLFDLTQFRILSLAIVIPALFRPQYGRDPLQPAFRREDAVLVAFLVLQLVLVFPYQSGTATIGTGGRSRCATPDRRRSPSSPKSTVPPSISIAGFSGSWTSS